MFITTNRRQSDNPSNGHHKEHTPRPSKDFQRRKLWQSFSRTTWAYYWFDISGWEHQWLEKPTLKYWVNWKKPSRENGKQVGRRNCSFTWQRSISHFKKCKFGSGRPSIYETHTSTLESDPAPSFRNWKSYWEDGRFKMTVNSKNAPIMTFQETRHSSIKKA